MRGDAQQGGAPQWTIACRWKWERDLGYFPGSWGSGNVEGQEDLWEILIEGTGRDQSPERSYANARL